MVKVRAIKLRGSKGKRKGACRCANSFGQEGLEKMTFSKNLKEVPDFGEQDFRRRNGKCKGPGAGVFRERPE